MFAVTPTKALRSVRMMNGPTRWEPCRVVGIKDEGGEPHYIVEVFDDGESYLTTAETLRYPAPTA